jgi:alkanesulfonate monooxygenase
MSGGRVELGLGAGWFEAEHTAYGIPFPDTGERFDRLEEQLAVVTGLWGSGGDFSYEGEHYTVRDSPGLPKPAQEKPPVLIGGGGKRRTPALAARYADEFNLPFMPFGAGLEQNDRVRRACEEIGRDPATMRFSSALVLCVGADEAEVARRAASIGREVGELRENGLAGTPAEVVDKIGRYAESGQSRLYLQTLDLHDLDHLRLVAAEVMPHVS